MSGSCLFRRINCFKLQFLVTRKADRKYVGEGSKRAAIPGHSGFYAEKTINRRQADIDFVKVFTHIFTTCSDAEGFWGWGAQGVYLKMTRGHV